MSGTKTNLKDLGKSFQKMKAQEGADARKLAMINEFTRAYTRQGFSVYMAAHLAAEQYRNIHKNECERLQ